MELHDLSDRVQSRLDGMESDGLVSRIWNRDPLVWAAEEGTPEVTDRLGWLDSPEWAAGRVSELQALSEVGSGCETVWLLGMGGSSLAPGVLGSILPSASSTALNVLDTTCPDTVKDIVSGLDPTHSLVVVSSKSGTTVETISLFEVFWKEIGAHGAQFVAVTDPDTPLARLAAQREFRSVFLNPADIGGRFSALSYFGLVPAALAGVEVQQVIGRAMAMREACRNTGDVHSNPGAMLGAALGEAQQAGRDKLMIVVSPELKSFGLWIEQLVAESTGKDGRGIVPVIESTDSARFTGAPDRLWVLITSESDDSHHAAGVAVLSDLHAPFVDIRLHEATDVGAEMFRWEFATAVACHVMGVNPFNQPDVENSKRLARLILERGEGETGRTEGGVEKVLNQAVPGDYIALLCFCRPSRQVDLELSRLKSVLEERFRVPVTAAYGPRYLHSSGQLHKGAGNNGVFLVILDDSEEDLAIPGTSYGFRALFRAQARADFGALRAKGRRAALVPGLGYLKDRIA